MENLPETSRLETKAEKMVKSLAEKLDTEFPFLKKEKEYLDVSELSREKYTLSWGLFHRHLLESLEEKFEKKGLVLYRDKRFYVRDEKLGRVTGLFNYKGRGKIYLEYEPESLKEGSVFFEKKGQKDLAREAICLKKRGQNLSLPNRFYLSEEVSDEEYSSINPGFM
jgi:hypothetical protein